MNQQATLSLFQQDEEKAQSWSLVTPCTSSLGSLLALTGALAGHMQPYQKMDPEHLNAYKRAFDEFDLDGDGKISTQVTPQQLIFQK